MTENRGRRSRSGQMGLQSQVAETSYPLLREKEGIVQMDEMPVEARAAPRDCRQLYARGRVFNVPSAHPFQGHYQS
jgi:hypothetical protein